MNREKAKRYVEYVVDDTGNGREWGEDMYAIVREKGENLLGRMELVQYYSFPSKLVVWKHTTHNQSSHFYMVVAVHSYMDGYITDSEAEELARDYLCEIGFFKEGSFPADYIF